MTIKTKISFYISLLFTFMFSAICIFVILSFSKFKKDEFEERLHSKVLTSIKLLVDIEEGDNNLLKIINQNTINKIYNEKTLIFDPKFNLIYSSLDDTKVHWTIADLIRLKQDKTFYREDGENEVFGMFYDSNNEDYFAIISANDAVGKRKLNYLISLIIGVGIVFIIAIWLVTFRVVKKQLTPLDKFHAKIREINDFHKDTIIETKSNSKNEIDLIGKEFNSMIHRISEVYQKQKEFTSNASHEFRTPLARISTQLENQIQHANPQESIFLKSIFQDINQLNDLVNSLLVLTKIDMITTNDSENELIRIDEALYNSIEKITKDFPDFKINFNINEIENLEDLLTIKCNQNLLEIAITNLLKNAYFYSDNKTANIELIATNKKIAIQVSNTGKTISKAEQVRLFEPFMRGENAKQQKGLGLGLKIVQRIIFSYGFSVTYSDKSKLNSFIIEF